MLTTLGLRQGPVNFYDGQGFVVKEFGVKELKDLKGATICVTQGTTHEVTLGDYGRINGIDWKPFVFDRPDTMQQPSSASPRRLDPACFRAAGSVVPPRPIRPTISCYQSSSARSRSARSRVTATRSGATSSPGCTMV